MSAPQETGPHGLLRDRVVLITGGTAGLGAGVARAAAREGALVGVTDRGYSARSAAARSG